MRQMSPWRAILPLALPLLAITVGGAGEPPRSMGASALISFCRSLTLATATATGDALGWTRADDGPADADWRAAILRAQGGVAHAVRWTRSAGDQTESLAFWTVRGATSYNSCSYSTADSVEAWHDGLTAALGAPSFADKSEIIHAESWTAGALQVALTHVGSVTLIEMGTSP